MCSHISSTNKSLILQYHDTIHPPHGMQGSRPRQGVCSLHYKPWSSILYYYEINTLRMECRAQGQDKLPTSHYYEPTMEVARFNPWIFLPLEIKKKKSFYLEIMCNLFTCSLSLYQCFNTIPKIIIKWNWVQNWISQMLFS